MYKNFFCLSVIILLLIGCNHGTKDISYESSVLKIEAITASTFTHISYLTFGNNKVACNGLIYLHQDSAILFDTPADSLATEELIKWLNESKINIKAVISGHFHEDCIGGLIPLHRSGVVSYANHQTIELANGIKVEPPQIGFSDSIVIKVGDQFVMAKHLGEGHTADNIVGYIPKEKVLFGGCLIKAIGADYGYTGDANLSEWSNSVRKVKQSFPSAKYIVPGHGPVGDQSLLDYTILLFEKEAK